MINVDVIHDDSDRHALAILERGLNEVEDPHIERNYNCRWRDHNSNIFYLLANGRYKRGAYYVLSCGGQYVASAGWNEYELDTSIALALTRAYVHPRWRTQYLMAEYILPHIITSTRQYVHLYITVNPHNTALYNYFRRSADGKSTALFSNWPPIYKKFIPRGQATIYYTQQWIFEYGE
jgi:hypothetical protein